ncbi:hypothetical protein ABC733_02940 [Mangrovibacter sp. SLW1]
MVLVTFAVPDAGVGLFVLSDVAGGFVRCQCSVLIAYGLQAVREKNNASAGKTQRKTAGKTLLFW